jgi:dihydroorotate dehydrogenase electron transfer subunit
MQQFQGLVTRREALTDDWQRVWLRMPSLARQVRPGQLLAVKPGTSPFDPLLRAPLGIAGADTSDGSIGLVLPPGSAATLPHRAAEYVDTLGPIGRGWSLHEQTRNVVLAGGDAEVAPLLFLAELAVARGWNVALLVGSVEGHPPLPPALVPPAVEYQWAQGGDPAAAALDLLDDTLVAWADALYTTLPVQVYPALADRIRRARVRWLPGFAQGLLVPAMACFVGICDVCLVPESSRPWRACVDGPQCDIRHFVRL